MRYIVLLLWTSPLFADYLSFSETSFGNAKRLALASIRAVDQSDASAVYYMPSILSFSPHWGQMQIDAVWTEKELLDVDAQNGRDGSEYGVYNYSSFLAFGDFIIGLSFLNSHIEEFDFISSRSGDTEIRKLSFLHEKKVFSLSYQISEQWSLALGVSQNLYSLQYQFQSSNALQQPIDIEKSDNSFSWIASTSFLASESLSLHLFYEPSFTMEIDTSENVNIPDPGFFQNAYQPEIWSLNAIFTPLLSLKLFLSVEWLKLPQNPSIISSYSVASSDFLQFQNNALQWRLASAYSVNWNDTLKSEFFIGSFQEVVQREAVKTSQHYSFGSSISLQSLRLSVGADHSAFAGAYQVSLDYSIDSLF